MEKKQPQVRREEILAQTTSLIGELGTGALRVGDVAKALGISPPLIIYHFRTRENLIAEALHHAAQGDLVRLRALMAEPGSEAQRLMRIVRWYTPTEGARGWRFWIEGWSHALREKSGAEVVRALDAEWKRAFAEVLAAGCAAGEFEVADPCSAAMRIQAFLDGVAVQKVVYRQAVDHADLERWLGSVLSHEIGLPQESVDRE